MQIEKACAALMVVAYFGYAVGGVILERKLAAHRQAMRMGSENVERFADEEKNLLRLDRIWRRSRVPLLILLTLAIWFLCGRLGK